MEQLDEPDESCTMAQPLGQREKKKKKKKNVPLSVEWRSNRGRRWIFFEIKENEPHPPRWHRREGPIDAISGRN
jgi:hypothetical protein